MWFFALLLLLLLLLLLSACLSPRDDAVPVPSTELTTTRPSTTVEPTTTTTEPTTTTTALTEATRPELVLATEWDSELDEIFGRYLQYWDAIFIIAGPPRPDPHHPLLEEFLTEEMVGLVGAQLQGDLDQNVVLVDREGGIGGHILRLPSPMVLSKEEGNTVYIQDCHIIDAVELDPDGNVVVTHREPILRNVTMTVEDGRWLVGSSGAAGSESDGYEECNSYLDYLDSGEEPPCPTCWPYTVKEDE